VRHVVNVEAARMNVDSVADRLVALSRANGKAPVYIESNGAGVGIVSAVGKQVPCRGLNTSAQSKRARVESLSAELASGRWAFRNPTGVPSEQLKRLCDELAVFSFDAHCGDRASALLLASEAARLFEDKPKGRVFDAAFLTRR
jgi:hypothetical protein